MEMNERDLYTLDGYSNYTDIDEVKQIWSYDFDDFDDDAKEITLWKIFSEQNPAWFKALKYLLKRNRGDIFYFVIYWAKYQEDLMDLYNHVKLCLKDIDSQIDDIEIEIQDAKAEKEKAEKEYYELADKIESLTGDRNYPAIEKVSTSTYVSKIWQVNYSDIEDEDERDNAESDCESYLDDMDGWKDDYHNQDELIDHYTDLLEQARQNYSQADNFADELVDWMYEG